MAKQKRVIFIRLIYISLDIFCVGLAILLACWIRQETLPFPLSVKTLFWDYTNPFHFVSVLLAVTVIFFNHINGLYQTRRELLEWQEILRVIKSVFYSCLGMVVAIYALKVEGFPRGVFLLTFLFVNVFLSSWRVLKRVFVEFLVVRGYNNFNVLIIGAGKIGITLANEIKRRPGIGLRVVGFLDDFKSKEEYGGINVIGKIADFPEISRKEFITKIFITVHHDSEMFLQLLEQARDLNVAVRVIPQGFEFTTGDFFKYNIGFIPVLEYSDAELTLKQTGKRIFDFILSLALTLGLSPVFFLIALLIQLDSRGPIFYYSRRYGCRGKTFRMIKFRSMLRDADQSQDDLRPLNEVDGPIFKIKTDPRVTRLGRLLRKYSLDELPQLFNVLKGEMSLVGPRPLPIEQIEKEDLRQLKRLDVRPGITGLWQIRGRSDISFSRLLRWDIWYINNWSFWLDLNILLKTIPVVFRGKGAY
jgi:exopolysaccharide biosynthesis polyprenyl glycosylphosphotransferase